MVTSILDAALLFALSVPIVMQYRIMPIEGTPYWLFGVLFAVLGINCFVSLYPDVLGKARKHLGGLKLLFLTLAVTISLGGAAWTSVIDRARTAPVLGVHDIILQQEAAIRYFVNGKNPYKETYFGTPVESFHYAEIDNENAVNPALWHFVMPPWYLLFPLPVYYVSVHTLGFFDGRQALMLTMLLLLAGLWFWFRDRGLARIAMVLTALSPAVAGYFIEGRSDIFALSWLILSMVLLERKRYIWSSVMMALAVTSKQTTWFVLPFYFLALGKHPGFRSPRFVWSATAFVAVVLALTVPFIVWDPKAFSDSVIFYLTGNSEHSYPVSGYGLGMVLYEFGIIRNLHAYYPFILWQVAIAVPVLILLVRWLWRTPTQSRIITAYAVFLLTYWYLSRYFNNSHLGYLSVLFVIGGLKAADEARV